MSRKKKAPSVYMIGGVALSVPRSVARAVWWVTGVAPHGARVKVARPVALDPLASQQAADLRAVFTKCDVDAELVGAVVGPRITRYRVKPGAATKVEKVEACAKEIRLAMGTKKVSIVSPIPGEKGMIGVEIPRDDPQNVPLAPLLAQITDPHPLVVALGRAMDGTPRTPNLADMPHLLVAGTTGAGKSGCLNAILVSVLSRATPEQVELVLIDPKKVELTAYGSVPHLVGPIITDPKRAATALEQTCEEMDRRYDVLAAAKCKNIGEYNAAHPDAPMPYRLVIVDELGDLMVVAEKEVEGSVMRITQLARAAGIHLVVATQRPSTDVITGVIKANIPSRLAFAVATLVDSRVILDVGGAEHLLGKGDALFSPIGEEPDRMQGVWVTDEEILAAVAAAGSAPPRPAAPEVPGVQLGDDENTRRAIALCAKAPTISVKQLQENLRIGHKKASDLMAILEDRGIVGPARGNSPRAVLAEFE